jgi:hypothetical protein
MTLGNMRELGVWHLIAYCHNDAYRHQALIDVSSWPAETEVAYFQRNAKCSRCGGSRVDYIGKGGQHLGTVEAADERSAIAEAAKAFNITPARRFKIVVAEVEVRAPDDRDQRFRLIAITHSN